MSSLMKEQKGWHSRACYYAITDKEPQGEDDVVSYLENVRSTHPIPYVFPDEEAAWADAVEHFRKHREQQIRLLDAIAKLPAPPAFFQQEIEEAKKRVRIAEKGLEICKNRQRK